MSPDFYPRPPRGGRLDFGARNINHALFLSTPSARRATVAGFHAEADVLISIHALREEGDTHWQAPPATAPNFYPRPPRGGRPEDTDDGYRAGVFLSTPSARRATRQRQTCSDGHLISIHALREEGDGPTSKACPLPSYFYPRPPRGGRPRQTRPGGQRRKISIHALREEGDSHFLIRTKMARNFYPRPPRGGRLDTVDDDFTIADNFYPRPPRGGRPAGDFEASMSNVISIHALREEGDRPCYIWRSRCGISIHALREEGDASGLSIPAPGWRFLSTPSARRATQAGLVHQHYRQISIHALREEGDGQGANYWSIGDTFLSTPSARRATAKTETKSLFSNKLYNILHEFRRALIYNGSKNYPNHAK